MPIAFIFYSFWLCLVFQLPLPLGSRKPYKVTDDFILRRQLHIELTLVVVIGTPTYPKRFDLVARPTFPRCAEAIIVELKAGELGYQDLRQLLAYITLVRYIQTYSGSAGLGQLSEAIQFRITKRTRISGILIGRKVSPKLMEWIPEEVWSLVKVCTFRVRGGKWPDDLQEVQVYDRGYGFRRQRHVEGKRLRSALNLPQFRPPADTLTS